MVIAGAITLGVPYAIGLSFASSADFENQSGWLAVPGAGPWLTLALREDRCDEAIDTFSDCVTDPVIRFYLVLDGLAQTTGAILLLVGLTSTKQRLVADQTSKIVVLPVRIGSGYGLGLAGQF
jgi:hypothetical protein